MLRSIEEALAAEWVRLRLLLSRSLLGAGLALFAALAALEGLAVVIAGGYASLLSSLPPWAAGLVAGGLVILVALAALLLVVHSLRRSAPADREDGRPVHAGRRAAAGTDAPSVPGVLGAAAAELIGRNPVKPRDIALIALMAGVALGISPALRRQVFGHGKDGREAR